MIGPVLLGLASRGLTAAVPRQSSPSLSLQLSHTAPEDISDRVDPDFPGFAFEEASFVRYAEDDNGKANAFSQNLIKEITSRTGGHPIIRLGGTSPDYARYLPGQREPAVSILRDYFLAIPMYEYPSLQARGDYPLRQFMKARCPSTLIVLRTGSENNQKIENEK